MPYKLKKSLMGWYVPIVYSDICFILKLVNNTLFIE